MDSLFAFAFDARTPPLLFERWTLGFSGLLFSLFGSPEHARLSPFKREDEFNFKHHGILALHLLEKNAEIRSRTSRPSNWRLFPLSIVILTLFVPIKRFQNLSGLVLQGSGCLLFSVFRLEKLILLSGGLAWPQATLHKERLKNSFVRIC